MIVIDNTMISTELLEKKFVCDLQRCKGACCVEGAGGAPLEAGELPVMEEIFDAVKPYLTREGIAAIEQKGIYVKEEDDEFTGWGTPLIGNTGACAYVNYDEKNIAYCGIEKAFLDGKISFRKPVSCHLYPVRVKVSAGFTLVNYDEWDICDPACALGEQLQVPVYRFVKDAFIRRFGEEIYGVLETVAAKERDKS